MTPAPPANRSAPSPSHADYPARAPSSSPPSDQTRSTSPVSPRQTKMAGRLPTLGRGNRYQPITACAGSNRTKPHESDPGGQPNGENVKTTISTLSPEQTAFTRSSPFTTSGIPPHSTSATAPPPADHARKPTSPAVADSPAPPAATPAPTVDSPTALNATNATAPAATLASLDAPSARSQYHRPTSRTVCAVFVDNTITLTRTRSGGATIFDLNANIVLPSCPAEGDTLLISGE